MGGLGNSNAPGTRTLDFNISLHEITVTECIGGEYSKMSRYIKIDTTLQVTLRLHSYVWISYL